MKFLKNFRTQNKYLKVFITFHLALFAWIFFRANSVKDAIAVIFGIIDFNFSGAATQNVDLVGVAVGFLLIFLLEIAQLYFRNKRVENFFGRKK